MASEYVSLNQVCFNMLLNDPTDHSPALSIVCICFNNPLELDKTLGSCRTLAASEVEILVIDGSTDDACARVIAASSTPVRRHIQEPDRGIYDAMNKGIRVARGEGALMLNSGDLLYDASRFMEELRANRSKLATHVLFGGTIDEFSGIRVERALMREVTPEHIRQGIFPSHQSVIVPTSFCRQLPYDLSFKSAADTVFLRKAFSQLPSARLECVVSIFAYGGRSNAAPRLSQILPQYREMVRARDLGAWERLTKFVRLCARWLIGTVLGTEGHRRFQARNARRRASRQTS